MESPLLFSFKIQKYKKFSDSFKTIKNIVTITIFLKKNPENFNCILEMSIHLI